jgi:hypothetical protein
MKTIDIILDGGLVRDIQGIPEDYQVRIRDYDVEDAHPDDVKKDEKGLECFEFFWEV